MAKNVGFGSGGLFAGAGIGTNTKKSTFNFGGAASSAPTLGTATPFGGGFGAKTTGSNLFGTSTTTGFGGTDVKKPSVFNFGSTASTSAPAFGASTGFGSGFGSKTTSSSLFGGTSSTGFGFSKPTTSTGFGTNTMSGGLFGQQQQQQQQQPGNTQDNAAALLLNTATALSAPLVFGDERDAIIMKWNQIQAFWGTGKGYYRKDGSHINFNPENHFCHFKAVGFSCLPTMKDSDGFVSIVCNKKESDMRSAGESNVSGAIHKILGANANLSVKIDSIRPLPDNKCEMTIYVTEQSTTTGAVRRVLASELHRYMQQNNIQQQLQQQVLMEACVPRVTMSSEQIERILVNPPAGIDPVIWEQAKKDNPDPESLIPVPMIGFAELRNRLQHQEFMSKQHQSRLDILSKGLHDIQQEQVNTQSKIEQHKRKLLELSHRALKVIIAQEIIRKAGYAIQPEEEQLRVQLDAIANQLNAPTQFRSRLNELISQVRMRHHSTLPPALGASTSLDPDALAEIHAHLRKQQEGLSTLVKIVADDFRDLSVIDKTMAADEQAHDIRDSAAGYHGYRLHSYR